MSRTRMPARAAAPVPTTTAVGVASPKAQGQAMTRTETAAISDASKPPPSANQRANVALATTSTTGTKTLLTRSASRCACALPCCASATVRATRASMPSSPTRVARTSRWPVVFTAPPVTTSPTPLWTGMLSPVSSDSSTSLSPATTAPSTGTCSPGRTITTSPTATLAAAVSRTEPSAKRSSARCGRNVASLRMAVLVAHLARVSKYLPSSTSVMMVADASKYSSPSAAAPSASSRYQL